MQPVFCLVPHHAPRSVYDLGGNFFAAVGWQAVHEKRVRFRPAHHLFIHLPVLEGTPPRLVLLLEAHRGPHVGGYEIGVPCGIHRVGEFLIMIGAIQACALGLDFVAGRGRYMHIEAEHLGRLQPGVADII